MRTFVAFSRVSGYEVGNLTGQVPLSDGTINTNLNADLLDGAVIMEYNPNRDLVIKHSDKKY